MMTLCPHCGHSLQAVLVNGITACLHCSRCFDSSRTNQLLSLAWVVRRNDLNDPELLMNHYCVSREDADLVLKFVDENSYSHEEFEKYLKESREFKLDQAC
jgi:hypothetical protein